MKLKSRNCPRSTLNDTEVKAKAENTAREHRATVKIIHPRVGLSSSAIMNMQFSIITVARNAEVTVAKTLQSVAAQSEVTVEHILVDGASTDGTLPILKTYRAGMEDRPDRRIRLISEPDRGIYDALNKGIRQTTGDVVGLLHADDFLAHEHVLANVAKRFKETDAVAAYGDLHYVREKMPAASRGREIRDPAYRLEPGASVSGDFGSSTFSVVRHWRSGPYDHRKLKWGWMPPHPTLFLKRTLYDQVTLPNGGFFDTGLSIAADYDFVLRMLADHQVQPVYLPEVLVKMRLGGKSNRSLRNMLRKSREDLQAMRRHRVGGIFTLAAKNFRKIPQFLT